MIRRAQPWLGTLVEIAVADALPEQDIHRAIALAFAEVALVHTLMSFHDSHSELSRLNRARAGEALQVHPHTWQVLLLAQEVQAASAGIFNIACAPCLVSWDCLPAPQAPAAEYVPGMSIFTLEADHRVRKLAPGWIDLGGIAKGYAVDLAIDALLHAGIGSALVNAGGDLRAVGERAWAVAVRDPQAPSRVGRQLDLCNEAMATSASYFSAKQWNGNTVSALVDGRTGNALSGALSASVRAPGCAVADALTKVVLATRDPLHPVLHAFHAAAFILENEVTVRL